jgi:uncharacterized protein (TIRG00374 family)
MNLLQKIQLFWNKENKTALQIRQILKILFIALLFLGLFWFVDFKAVLGVLTRADPWLVVIGLLLVFPAEFLNAVQLKFLVRRQKILFNVFQLYAINLSIKFYLLFLPGAIVGSGIRWYKLSQPQGKRAEALAAVTFNRLLETFLVVILGLIFWYLSGSKTGQLEIGYLILLFLVIAAIWVLVTRLSKPASEIVSAFRQRTTQHRYVYAVMVWIEKLLVAVAAYAEFPMWELVVLVCVGIFRYLLVLVGFQILAYSVGIYIPFVDMGWIFSVVSLFALIPFTYAGGLGVREVGLVFLLSSFGVNSETAIAFSLLIFTRILLLGLVGGLLELLGTARVKSSA